jgi:hypothetical protein
MSCVPPSNRNVSTDKGVARMEPLVVTGVSDAQAPEVDAGAARWTTATELDNSADRAVTLQVPVTDDLSGAAKVSVALTAPGAPTVTLAGRRVSGTARDGVWDVSGTVPAYAPAGTWTVASITATDAVGHARTLRPGDGPWPAPLSVTGESDVEAPTADMTFAEYVGPTSADNGADRTVTMRVRAADDLSGVAYLFLDYRTDGAQSRLDPIGPPDADGTWTLQGRLPATITPGQWRITGIYLTDRIGRQRVYYVQKNGSYTTSDGAFQGVAQFPEFTLTPVSGR